jgi:hypothetical protein
VAILSALALHICFLVGLGCLHSQFHGGTGAFAFRSRIEDPSNASWSVELLRHLKNHFAVPSEVFQSTAGTVLVYDITSTGNGCTPKSRRLNDSRVKSINEAIDDLVNAAIHAAGPLLSPVDCSSQSAGGLSPKRLALVVSLLLGSDRSSPSRGESLKTLAKTIEVERCKDDRSFTTRLNVIPVLQWLME